MDSLFVAHRDIIALPGIELVDIRRAHRIDLAQTAGAPSAASLRCLLVDDTGPLGTRFGEEVGLLASLVPTSIEHLSIKAQLTSDHLHTLATLRSLTALDLQHCDFDDTSALDCFVSEKGEPLLPNLQRFALHNYKAINVKDVCTSSTASFMRAYSRQLRHLKLASSSETGDSFAAALSVVLNAMPQLETLELASTVRSSELLEFIIVPKNDDMDEPHTPTLPALRSLTLRHLAISDAAIDMLLSSCPQLLELTVDRAGPMTAVVRSSLRHCRRLLSLSFHSASVLAPEATFTRAASSSSSTHFSYAAAGTSLTHLSLDFDNRSYVDLRGFTQLLGLLRGSPITSVMLRLPSNTDYPATAFVFRLGSLPHLSWLRLAEYGIEGFVSRRRPSFFRLTQALERHTHEPGRLSSEQHHVHMQHYWHDGLIGEESEDELRMKYAVSLKIPRGWLDGSEQVWCVFNRVQSEGEDGRKQFFQWLKGEA